MLSRPQNCSESVRRLQRRIAAGLQAAGRNVDSVTLLAVSKGQSAAAIDGAARAGIENFGENFLQESLPKIESLAGRELTWHFIGRLQANKTRPVAENFAWVHGVDRLKIAERLSAQRPYHAPPLNVCLQLHVGGEASKGGVEAAEIAPLARGRALPHIRLRGLMCMPPAEIESRVSDTGFARPARSSTISTNTVLAWIPCRWAPAPTSKRRSPKERPSYESAPRFSARVTPPPR